MKNQKYQSKTQKELHQAAAIIEAFEELLEKHSLIIPSNDRLDVNDARIYGEDYFELEDKIIDILRESNN